MLKEKHWKNRVEWSYTTLQDHTLCISLSGSIFCKAQRYVPSTSDLPVQPFRSNFLAVWFLLDFLMVNLYWYFLPKKQTLMRLSNQPVRLIEIVVCATTKTKAQGFAGVWGLVWQVRQQASAEPTYFSCGTATSCGLTFWCHSAVNVFSQATHPLLPWKVGDLNLSMRLGRSGLARTCPKLWRLFSCFSGSSNFWT